MAILNRPKNIEPEYGAVILAGGNSSRMNFPKMWLPFDEQRTFLEAIIETYIKAHIQNIIIVINKEFCTGEWKKNISKIQSGIKLIKNKNPDSGRIHSIKLGLQKIENVDFVFIHNVDNPFVESEVILKLCNNCCDNGTAISSYKGEGGHPVLISNAVINTIVDPQNDGKTLREILNLHKKKYVEVDSKNILINVNTLKEYKKSMHEFVR